MLAIQWFVSHRDFSPSSALLQVDKVIQVSLLVWGDDSWTTSFLSQRLLDRAPAFFWRFPITYVHCMQSALSLLLVSQSQNEKNSNTWSVFPFLYCTSKPGTSNTDTYPDPDIQQQYLSENFFVEVATNAVGNIHDRCELSTQTLVSIESFNNNAANQYDNVEYKDDALKRQTATSQNALPNTRPILLLTRMILSKTHTLRLVLKIYPTTSASVSTVCTLESLGGFRGCQQEWIGRSSRGKKSRSP